MFIQVIELFIELLLNKKNNKKLKSFDNRKMTKLLDGDNVEKDFLKEVSYVLQYQCDFIKV